MAKLTKIYEKSVKNVNGKLEFHELHVTTNIDISKREEAEQLDYSDFDVNLFVDGKFICDIGFILNKANSDSFNSLIDQTNWSELFCDTKAEAL